MDFLPAILIGYAIGSLPIGFLLAHSRRGVDLRRAGSRAVDIAATAVALLILFRHRGNIARAWSRTEPALGT